MPRLRLTVPFAVVLLSLGALAHADRRYFVQSYTPYLAPAGNLELEVTSIATSGQGDSTATAWQNRIEFEYGISDRLTGAIYLNFVQPPGLDAPMTFDGPSLELLYRLAEPGRLPVDPAVYLEVRANGSELELEPKLLLARRIYRLVAVTNLIGEFERHTDGAVPTEKALRVSAGLSRELGKAIAIGIEGLYTRELLDDAPDASALLVGPTLNWQTPRIQVALGWHPQLAGSPASSHGLDLADFPRSEVRLLVGVEL